MYTPVKIKFKTSLLKRKKYPKKEEKIYVRIDKMRRKIPIYLLLNSLGITRKKAFYTLQATKNIKHLLNKNEPSTTTKSLIKLNELITEKKVSIVSKKSFIKFFKYQSR